MDPKRALFRTRVGSASTKILTPLCTDHLFGFCEADAVGLKIVDRVVSPQERIAKYSKGTDGFGEVHAHKGRNARALNLKDVVVRTDGKVVAGKGEGKIGQAVALVALDSVLAVEALLRSHLLVPVTMR